MTLSITWIRRSKSGIEELISISDSRLSGDGYIWNQAPKMNTDLKNNMIFNFAGYTAFAYPLFLQVSSAINSYEKIASRKMPVEHVVKHVLTIINSLTKDIYIDPILKGSLMERVELEKVSFIFGGYSWSKEEFLFWKIKYSMKCKEYRLVTMNNPVGQGNRVVCIGDDDVIKEFYKRLKVLMRNHNGDNQDFFRKGIDYEPLIILRDMLRENRYESIGGVPQISVVLKYMELKEYGVYWPYYNSEFDNRYLSGRRIEGYEDIDNHFMDIDNFEIHRPMFSQNTQKDMDRGRRLYQQRTKLIRVLRNVLINKNKS